VSTDGHTHTHTHARTDAKRFYYLSHAICYGYGADNKRLMLLMQEIVLSSIMQVKSYAELSPATAADTEADAALLRNPPIFEMHVGIDMIYYVGEDPTWGGSKAEVVTSAESGVGLEQARCWESAIRKALMPVTPQPSADYDKGHFITYYLCDTLYC